MSLPKFEPEHFRDHADAERVDRIWSRIESDLPEQLSVVATPMRRSPRSRTAGWLVAASLSAFAVGVFVGHRAERTGASTLPVATQTTDVADSVLAAGSRSRTFALPGGGAVTLSPGGTIEIGETSGGLVTLRLVQGRAAIETAAGGSLAIVAGEARVSTLGAASLSVDRSGDAIDLAVSDGLVELEAPGDHRAVRSGEHVRAVTVTPIAISDAPTPHPVVPRAPSEPPALLGFHEAPAPMAAPAPVAVAAAPSWFTQYEGGHYDEALAAVEQSGGTASAIDRGRTARELMALEHLARKKGEKILAMRALTRVATEFPDDPNAKAAAMTLGNMHRQAGNDLLAAQYYDLAKNSVFGEDIACTRLQAMSATTPGAEQAARGYLAKYDNGRCRLLAEDLLSDVATAPDGEAKAPEAPTDAAPAPEGSARPSSPIAPPTPPPTTTDTPRQGEPDAPKKSP